MTGPRVYKAIVAVASELGRNGIAKSNFNARERYQYRSIDDVLHGLSPLLAKHRLCVLPRVLERTSVERIDLHGSYRSLVSLKIAYDLVSAHDASAHTIETFGEAQDDGDKATAKAMSSAYKMAMLQTFCVPVLGSEDTDASPSKLHRAELEPAPVQGWDQWADDIKEMVATCISTEALGRVQDRYRSQLKSISRERPDLYGSIGSSFAATKYRITELNKAHVPLTEGTGPTDLAPEKSGSDRLVTTNG